MVANFRADAVASPVNAAVASATIVVPATAVVGDYAIMGFTFTTSATSVGTVPTLTVSGGGATPWTVHSGPDLISAQIAGHLLGKTIEAADIGATLTLTVSTAQKISATMTVYSGVDPSGLTFAKLSKATSTSTITVPTIASVAAGSIFHASFQARVGSGTAPNVAIVEPYTQGTNSWHGTTAASGSNDSTEYAYQIASATGAMGGEQFTVSSAGLSWAYSVALPATVTAPAVTAPTVNAGADASLTVGSVFSRTATENANNGTITARSWTIVSGPAGAGTTIGTTAALNWTPTTVGTYVLRYSATNSAGTGTDDATITVTAADATPATISRVQTVTAVDWDDALADQTLITATLTNPATAGNLLLMAVAVDKSAGTFTAPTGFTVVGAQAGTSVSLGVFYKVAVGGETSATATWSSSRFGGTAILSEFSGVDGANPINGINFPASSETTRTSMALDPPAATAAGRAIAFFAADSISSALVPYDVSQFQPAATGWAIQSSAWQGDANNSGVPPLVYTERTANVTSGEDIGDTTFTWSSLDQTAGMAILLAASTAPATSPTVSAGADAAINVNTAFARTATESANGGTITSRAWTIVSGPTGSGTTIGTTAPLSWTPTVAGTYVLRYSATSSAGSGSDDVTVTVTASVPTLIHRAIGIPSGTAVPMSGRFTNTSSVRIKIGTNATVTTGVLFGSAATPNAQGDAQMTITGLTANTQYWYQFGMTPTGGGTEVLSSIAGPFITAPVGPTSFAFCFGSCDDAPDSPSWAAIAARNDPLFFHLGDALSDTLVSSYADGSGTDIANFRAKTAEKFVATNHASVYSKTPVSFTPSDHDGMNNGSHAGSDPTAWTNWNQVYREMWPTLDLPGTTGVYRTFVWGRVRFIQLDTRSFKTIASATDNASKTNLGTVQKQWLKDTITAATEPLILILQDGPWIGAAIAGDDNWPGYTTERAELADFFAASGKRIGMLAGDMHALAADDGTNAPGGIFVFQGAPLQNASSRKGGPYSVAAYPATGTAEVQQYGRVVVSDTGSSISLAFTGYSADDTARVSLTKTFALQGKITERWNGTTLVPVRSDKWSGTTLVQEIST